MTTRTVFTLLAASMIPVAAQLPTLPGREIPTLVTNRIAVVFMGDSYSAGEGAPNLSGAKWDDEPCHRSQENGRAAVGNTLRNALPSRLFATSTGIRRVSEFDYVDVACSGATITRGILGPYEGVTPMRPSGPGVRPKPFASQVDQAKAWMKTLGRTSVDVVVIGVGGNDVGFADAVATCINPASLACYYDAGLLAKMEYGDLGHPEIIGFSGLRRAFAQVDEALRRELKPSKIILVGYPTSVRNRYGDLCDRYADHFSIYPNPVDGSYHSRNDDLAGSTARLTSFESAWLESDLIHRLNTERRATTAPMGWEFIDVEQFTRTHGFCETDDKAWFNTAKDSWNTQGDFNGTAHPNRKGFQVARHFLLRKLARDLVIPVTVPPSGFVEEHGFFLIKKTNTTTAPSGPMAQNMQDRPEIFVNENTYADVLGQGDAGAIYQKEFIMRFQYLLNPTPDQITEIKLEISPFDFAQGAPETQIKRFAPLNPAQQSGMLDARVSSAEYPDNSVIHVRWRIKSRPFYDAAATPAITYSGQLKFRIKGAGGPMVKL